MRSTITLFLLVSWISFIQAQRGCETMEYLEMQMQSDPHIKETLRQIEEHTSRVGDLVQERNQSIINVPVVVHIVYKNNVENLSDDVIKQQVSVLNADFRRLNQDQTNRWPQADDMQINFCLANKDPQGKNTTGIIRRLTTQSYFTSTNDAVKFNTYGGSDAWPRDKYLNIWVCDISGSILGYAQFPGGNAYTDGVVIDYKSFGQGSHAEYPYHLGRTLTHEVGHWLNLKHIWGSVGCEEDDLVEDTPRASGPNYGCSIGNYSCGQTNMVENYMDYSYDGCMNLFTSGQKTRMKALFMPGGFRESLLSSHGCSETNPETNTCQTISVEIKLDNYPQETTWSIVDDIGNSIVQSPKYLSTQKNTVEVSTHCLGTGCYTFVVNDSYGDGICCKYGVGYIKGTIDNKEIFKADAFGTQAKIDFCIGAPSQPTCTDGILNGDESGIDCGGAYCMPCATCTDGILNQDETNIDCGGSYCLPCSNSPSGENPIESMGFYFEDGWEEWIGGQTDTYRYNGPFAPEGQYALMIRDNSGNQSTITSPQIPIVPNTTYQVSFQYFAYSMEPGEKFHLEYYDGQQWQNIKTYISGTDFVNQTFYQSTYDLPLLTENITNTQLRFICDASTNADQVYIDAVVLNGHGSNREDNLSPHNIILGEYFGTNSGDNNANISISPNPASEWLTLKSDQDIQKVMIYDPIGRLIYQRDIHQSGQEVETEVILDIQFLSPDIYYLTIFSEETQTVEKFVKL